MKVDSVIGFMSRMGVWCCLLLVFITPAQARKGDVYTVAKLSVDIKAKDAVTAKGKALALAKSRALQTMFRRIAPFNSFDAMPAPKPETIENLLAGFSVRRERNSATQYIATLDFTFQASAVRKLLSERKIIITDQQADPVTVLPIYIRKGKIDQSGVNPWRTAWNSLDLENAIVPVRLVRAGPDFTMETLSSIIGGELNAYVALREKYKTRQLVLAIAEPALDGKTLTTRLFGFDQAGSVSLIRNEHIYNGKEKPAAISSAEISLGVFAGRWKLSQTPRGGPGVVTAPAAVDLVVEFSGFQEWKEIRKRLMKIPGVNGLDIRSLSARTAQLAFEYPGGADSLSLAVPDHGLAMQGAGDAWILRVN